MVNHPGLQLWLTDYQVVLKGGPIGEQNTERDEQNEADDQDELVFQFLNIQTHGVI